MYLEHWGAVAFVPFHRDGAVRKFLAPENLDLVNSTRPLCSIFIGPRRRSLKHSSPASVRHPTPVSQYSHPHPMPTSCPTTHERTDDRPMLLVTLFTLASFSQPPFLPPQRGFPCSRNAITPARSSTTKAVKPEQTMELPLVRSESPC